MLSERLDVAQRWNLQVKARPIHYPQPPESSTSYESYWNVLRQAPSGIIMLLHSALERLRVERMRQHAFCKLTKEKCYCLTRLSYYINCASLQCSAMAGQTFAHPICVCQAALRPEQTASRFYGSGQVTRENF